MPLLSVNQLTKKYNQKKVVKNVNFQLQSDQCIALIGPNGAGKTTILRMLATLIKPSSGTIQLHKENDHKDIRSLIGYLPQHPNFYSWMTGMECLVYSGELAFLSKSEANIQAKQLLNKVGILEAKNKRIGTYSGGMKQRLGIAQAIIHQPKLLIMDEPVSSLDPIGRRDILTLMEKLKTKMTILFSTHILTDADEISDELLLLHEGEIVESGSMDDLREKYKTSSIEVQIEGDLIFYQKQMNNMSSVINCLIKQDTLHISVTNIDQARQDILSAATKNNWPLTNFTINRASLEDMFMKVVNNSCNG